MNLLSEPIIIAMKPVDRNYAENARRWGVSGLNVDCSRIPANGENRDRPPSNSNGTAFQVIANRNEATTGHSAGRFPANLITDGSEAVEKEFAKAGVRVSLPGFRGKLTSDGGKGKATNFSRRGSEYSDHNDSGTASRFFKKCPADSHNPELPEIEETMNELKINSVVTGDCLDVMREMPDNCIDTILTDPPYGYTFMGKNWDHGVPGVEFWREALRVAKPGATLMAFGGTRTHHRLMVAIEDAGWEIRDCVEYLHDGSFQEGAFFSSLSDEQKSAYLELHNSNNTRFWVYGSGFPKSANISKQLDKAAIIECPDCDGGVAFDVDEKEQGTCKNCDIYMATDNGKCPTCGSDMIDLEMVGWPRPCGRCGGTGKVKGAEREVVGDVIGLGDKKAYPRNASNNNSSWEIGDSNGVYQSRGQITTPTTPLAKKFDGFGTALKPSNEPIIYAQKPVDGTYAENAEKWGVSGLDVDGGRVEAGERPKRVLDAKETKNNSYSGRMNGSLAGGSKSVGTTDLGRFPANTIHDGSDDVEAEFAKVGVRVAGAGGHPQSSKRSGNSGLVGLGAEGFKIGHNDSGTASRFFYCAKSSPSERSKYNIHPTVKPLSLCRYLAKLTRPPDGGIVLDMFAGSGTTALAAIAENRDFIMIEKEPEYANIARRRIAEYTGAEIEEKEIEIDNETVKQMALW